MRYVGCAYNSFWRNISGTPGPTVSDLQKLLTAPNGLVRLVSAQLTHIQNRPSSLSRLRTFHCSTSFWEYDLAHQVCCLFKSRYARGHPAAGSKPNLFQATAFGKHLFLRNCRKSNNDSQQRKSNLQHGDMSNIDGDDKNNDGGLHEGHKILSFLVDNDSAAQRNSWDSTSCLKPPCQDEAERAKSLQILQHAHFKIQGKQRAKNVATCGSEVGLPRKNANRCKSKKPRPLGRADA